MTEIKAMKENPKISKKTAQLKDYNGKDIKSKGQCRLQVTIKGKSHNVLFYVVPEGRESLLGGMSANKLNLVKKIYNINCSEAVRAQTEQEIENHVNMVVESLPVSHVKSKRD